MKTRKLFLGGRDSRKRRLAQENNEYAGAKKNGRLQKPKKKPHLADAFVQSEEEIARKLGPRVRSA